ncbi:hypothetical protein EV363DRAFT_79282 [Boletus edulis]|nr:hypothetical protein EV363DRAFT_79282 [Boletus edulis]
MVDDSPSSACEWDKAHVFPQPRVGSQNHRHLKQGYSTCVRLRSWYTHGGDLEGILTADVRGSDKHRNEDMEIIFHPAFPIFYARGRVVEDLALGRETIELRPEGHPNRSTSLNNVAADLSARYKRLGGAEDLDEAIALGREALDHLQKGQPDRPTSLDNLASVFVIGSHWG